METGNGNWKLQKWKCNLLAVVVIQMLLVFVPRHPSALLPPVFVFPCVHSVMCDSSVFLIWVIVYVLSIFYSPYLVTSRFCSPIKWNAFLYILHSNSVLWRQGCRTAILRRYCTIQRASALRYGTAVLATIFLMQGCCVATYNSSQCYI